MSYLGEHITWEGPDQEHITSRSQRYPGAVDIQPEWTQEVLEDPDRLVIDPDTKAHGPDTLRLIGHSPSAGFVITVVVYRESDGRLFGATAWKTSGRELRSYLERIDR